MYNKNQKRIFVTLLRTIDLNKIFHEKCSFIDVKHHTLFLNKYQFCFQDITEIVGSTFTKLKSLLKRNQMKSKIKTETINRKCLELF